jgi:hypothetical protein
MLVDLAENLLLGNSGQVTSLHGKSLLRGIDMLNFKYEDDFQMNLNMMMTFKRIKKIFCGNILEIISA